MKSTATAALAAIALWLSGTIATLPALAQDGDLGLDLVTAEEILAWGEANGFSTDQPDGPYQPADGDPWGDLDPTPDQLEQWAAAAAQAEAEAEAQAQAETDAYNQYSEDIEYLQDEWRESGSDQSFDDWLEEMTTSDGDSGDWSDDFEEWGDDDWDQSDDDDQDDSGDGDRDDSGDGDRDAAANRLALEDYLLDQWLESGSDSYWDWLDALRDRWTRSGSHLPFGDWLHQVSEESGGDDRDDTDTHDSAWMNDLDAMTVGLMPGGAGFDDPSALVDMIAADDDAILVVAWTGADGLAIGERDRLEAVRDAIAVGTPGQIGTVDAVICEPAAVVVATLGPGVVLTAGPSEFLE